MMILNAIIAGILGAYVGKFLFVTIHNLPSILLDDEEGDPREIFAIFFNESICAKCNHVTTFIERTPIIGRLLTHGKCHYCNKNFEKLALYLEIGVATLFFLSALFFEMNSHLIMVLIAVCLLICSFITDFEHGILPDQFTLSLVWLGLIGSLFPLFVTPEQAIAGAAAGFGGFWVFNLFYLSLRNMDGMFPGDFKLNAGIGALLGIKWLFVTVAASMILLVIVTLYQAFSQKGKSTYSLLTKEAPYGCYSSVVTTVVLYLMLIGIIS
jgi:leader peptidase (prepilin peptidase)/N-methyltransferase